MKIKSTANPFSTGGGGLVFEIKVQAGLLAMLLIRGYAPAFDSSVVEELHLQAEHFGYETDNALVICSDGGWRGTPTQTTLVSEASVRIH